MSNGLNITSVEAVSDFRLHLKRLAHALEEALLSADAEALRAHAEIEEAIDRARAKIQLCRDQVARARANLFECQRSEREERGRSLNCEDEEVALEEAEEALEEAEEKLDEVVRAKRLLEDASEEYSRRAQALRQFLECDLSRADGFLAMKLTALELYLATSPPLCPTRSEAGGSSGPIVLASLNAALSVSLNVTMTSGTEEEKEHAISPPPIDDATDYRRLRSRTPSLELRRLVNPPGPKFDPVYKHTVDRLDADHIVPVKEILGMPGFADLPEEKKVAILNLPSNILGVSREVNASRGGRTWADYEGHTRLGPIPPQEKNKMIARDKQAREAIRDAIDEASQQ